MKYGISSSLDENGTEIIQDVRCEFVESCNDSGAASEMAKNGDGHLTETAGKEELRRDAAIPSVTRQARGDDEEETKDAVIFSIQFYGKTIGEVGMMDQDLSELDWKRFKSYLFQNLLSVNHQENICVSYSDEEGDKLPIESDEEYQEALKVAKKKAEMHDKLVLDITRQGGFPAMLSLVSSGIRKVSSSPPKEGGISFFKASSPPKDVLSGTKAVGAERKLFPGFFLPYKGPMPGHVQGMRGYDCDEALECGKINVTSSTTSTTSIPASSVRTDCKRGPPVRALRNSPPSLLFKYEAPCTLNLKTTTTASASTLDSARQGIVFGAGHTSDASSGARPKDGWTDRTLANHPPSWFTAYMDKFRNDVCEEVSHRVVAQIRTNMCEEVSDLIASKVTEIFRSNRLSTSDLNEIQHGWSPLNLPEHRQDCTDNDTKRIFIKHKKSNDCDTCKDDVQEDTEDTTKRLLSKYKKSKDCDTTDDDAIGKEKLKKKMPRMAENGVSSAAAVNDNGKFRKRDFKNLGAKQKKLIMEEERLLKKQEKLEKKKFLLASKYAEERDKASRTQEKVLAKMEGLRKKQSCSQEEFSKLRKMVDKHQRLITAEQRQQRRNERKASYQKAGKSKKINIDNKCFPVDASLLHAALQELEALAEDSMSDGAGCVATRGYDALYLKDITFPDGSVVAPGTEFVKTWRVVNNGVIPWNEKTTLCKWSQVRFRGSPAGWKLKPSMKRVACPPLEPGQEGDISITFTAPSEPGWYATHWRFCQRGRVFGNQMWCAIHVVEEPVLFEPTKTIQGVRSSSGDSGVTKATLAADEIPELSSVIVCKSTTRDLFLGRHSSLGEKSLKEVLIPHPREELGVHTDLGIVENYYDAEDPVQRECTEGLQNLSLNNKDTFITIDDRKERDLISFEEEAEVLSSATSTPEIISTVSQGHSVVPLKEMAKESVENLIVKTPALKSQLKSTVLQETLQTDSISMSSGSFSELDSEDQAIMNESDSDGSENEYYVVHLPDCFNMKSLDNDEAHTQETTGGFVGDGERPDSTDFLTADEDDRTTAVASDSSEDLTCPLNDHNYASRSSTVSQASYRINPAYKAFVGSENMPNSTSDKEKSKMKKEEASGSGAASTLPDPPTDTKPFMSIPKEALQTSVLQPVPQIPGEESMHLFNGQEQDINTWASGSCVTRNVVCEQPYSAQHKETQKGADTSTAEASSANSANNNSSGSFSSQLQADIVGALPDELVSIIPEDLVRGAWNTARSLITRINQEMLSPTSDSPGRVYSPEEEASSEQQEQPPSIDLESNSQPEETSQDPANPLDEKESTSPLPPPLQQLEDMGFHNHEVNELLLTKYSGDVSRAVAELIILNSN
ncbi:hypothetical protein SK128_013618 [Halocaridina rubra]|uniref:Uncharacterized protein n=1 Tax=Halocaridina rubra TaxID=373956 RepID=A0AAN8WV86_HALRR